MSKGLHRYLSTDSGGFILSVYLQTRAERNLLKGKRALVLGSLFLSGAIASAGHQPFLGNIGATSTPADWLPQLNQKHKRDRAKKERSRHF